MPKVLAPAKSGRPRRNLIDVLRTQLWFHVLKLRSALASSYALEKALEPHLVRTTDDGVKRPRKWDSYERGSRVPKRKHDETDSVALAERHYPGAASFFDSPIWDILKGGEHDRWKLQRLLGNLASDVVDVLITRNGTIKGQAELVQLMPSHFDRLVEIGSFDALAATAILSKLSEQTASTELRDMALACYARLQPILVDAVDTCVHYPELFTYMDKVCQYWVLVSPGNRVNMHLFWHGHDWAKGRQSYYGPKLAQLSRAHGRDDWWVKNYS